MASGLNIKHSSGVSIKLIILAVAAALLTLVAFYGIRWYTTGELPPFPVPVAAAGPTIDESDVTREMKTAFKMSGAQPRYLSIPALGIDKARIQPVEISALHTLELPTNIHDSGWCKNSATPGSGRGVTLLNGRSSGVSRPGIFAGIKDMQAGMDIIVERGDGETLNYKVTDVNTMSVQALNAGGLKQMMHPIAGEAESLGIVATSGNWVPKIQEYNRRILVRAALLE